MKDYYPSCCLIVALLTVLAWCVDAPADDSGMRVWKDKTGKHEVQARFVGLKDDVVTLEQADGKTLEIKLDSLGIEEQKLALSLSSKMMDKPGGTPANPFTEKPSPSGGEPRVITVQWSKATALNPQKAPAGWKLEADPAPAAAPADSGAIEWSEQRIYGAELSGSVVNPRSGQACLVFVPRFSASSGESRLEIVDLKRGQKVSSATVSGAWVPLGITDDGKQLVLRSNDFGSGGGQRLTVWDFDETSATPLKGWLCSASKVEFHRDIQWGGLLPGGLLATLTKDGRVAVWEIASGRPRFYMDMGAFGRGHASISAGGRYLLCGVGSDLVAIEPARGRLVGSLNIPEAADQTVRLSFSPDGTRFAFGYGTHLQIHRLANGELLQDVATSTVSSAPVWTSDSHVLIGSSLISLEQETPFWSYSGIDQALPYGDTTWCLTHDRSSAALLRLNLPHRGALALLERGASDPSFYVIQPGAALKLNLSGIDDQTARQSVEEALTARLARLGFVIDPNAPLELQASVKRGATRKVQFRAIGLFGLPSSGESRDVTEWVMSIGIVSGGETLWANQQISLANALTLQSGESIDQALARKDKPNYEFFRSTSIPRYVPRRSKDGTLGASTVAPAGLQ